MAALVFSYPALELLGRNISMAGRWRSILTGLVMMQVVGWALYGLARIARADRVPAAFAAVVGSFFFWRGRDVVDFLGPWAAVLLTLVLAAATGLIAHRLRETNWLSPLLAGLAVFVLLNSSVSGARAYGELAEATPNDLSTSPPAAALGATGDVFVVVLDGYPSQPTLLLDHEFDNQAFFDRLNSAGLVVPDYVWTPYSATFLTLSSLFEPSTDYRAGHVFELADLSATSMITGGHGTLFRAFSDARFEVHYVESGWGGTTCRQPEHRCHHSAFLSEYPMFLLERSVVGMWSEAHVGTRWSRGALNAMDSTVALARSLTENGQRDMVFAHVIAPHEPFVLSDDCELVQYLPTVPVSTRLAEQLGCVNGFVEDLVRELPADASLVVFSDHGPDVRRQMVRPAASWSQDDVRERLTGFFAMRTAAACETPTTRLLTSWFQAFLDCTIDPAPQVDNRGVSAVAWQPGDVVVDIDPERMRSIDGTLMDALRARG